MPGSTVLTTKEWLNSEHALSSGLVEERYDAQRGVVVREAGAVLWFKRPEVKQTSELRESGKKAALAAFASAELNGQPRTTMNCLAGVKVAIA